MSRDETYLTRGGYEKLIQDLEYLRNDKRREIAAALARAREMGDLRENAEYDAAKDAQAHNEKRIIELEDKLSHARIIDDQDIPADTVLFGATVTLKDLDTDEECRYTLVSELEADYDQGKISIKSPIGAALLGHKEAEEVEIKVPAGLLKYKIIKIER